MLRRVPRRDPAAAVRPIVKMNIMLYPYMFFFFFHSRTYGQLYPKREATFGHVFDDQQNRIGKIHEPVFVSSCISDLNDDVPMQTLQTRLTEPEINTSHRESFIVYNNNINALKSIVKYVNTVLKSKCSNLDLCTQFVYLQQ